MSEIELLELSRRLGELPLLDVRRPDEFAQGHLPGAANLPVEELVVLDRAEIAARLKLAEGAELAVYCHVGARSALAVELLRSLGYDARNYSGSWREWSASGLPFEQA